MNYCKEMLRQTVIPVNNTVEYHLKWYHKCCYYIVINNNTYDNILNGNDFEQTSVPILRSKE